MKMGRLKSLARKLRLIAKGKIRMAPRWADIRKFGLKRARTRRITVAKRRDKKHTKLKA